MTIFLPWGFGPTAIFGTAYGYDSPQEDSEELPMVTQELSFWLGRVQRIQIDVDLTADDGISIANYAETFDTYKGIFSDGVGWLDGPYVEIEEGAASMPGWTWSRTAGGAITGLSFTLVQNNHVRERLLTFPEIRWRGRTEFLFVPAVTTFPAGVDEISSTPGVGKSATGVTLDLVGSDPVLSSTYSHNIPLYKRNISTVNWTGTVTVTPYSWYGWGVGGRPVVYDTTTGDYA